MQIVFNVQTAFKMQTVECVCKGLKIGYAQYFMIYTEEESRTIYLNLIIQLINYISKSKL